MSYGRGVGARAKDSEGKKLYRDRGENKGRERVEKTKQKGRRKKS